MNWSTAFFGALVDDVVGVGIRVQAEDVFADLHEGRVAAEQHTGSGSIKVVVVNCGCAVISLVNR